jgi:hypothetical protein
MEEEIWRRLPIELYFIIKKLYLKKVEKCFRNHLAYKSSERQRATEYYPNIFISDLPIPTCSVGRYWQDFYDLFTIKEIMIKGLGFTKIK